MFSFTVMKLCTGVCACACACVVLCSLIPRVVSRTHQLHQHPDFSVSESRSRALPPPPLLTLGKKPPICPPAVVVLFRERGMNEIGRNLPQSTLETRLGGCVEWPCLPFRG